MQLGGSIQGSSLTTHLFPMTVETLGTKPLTHVCSYMIHCKKKLNHEEDNSMNRIMATLLLFSLALQSLHASTNQVAPNTDETNIRMIITNFLNIMAQGMNLVASHGNKEAQLNAGVNILNSLRDILINATKRLPTEDAISPQEFTQRIMSTLDAMHVPELLVEEYCMRSKSLLNPAIVAHDSD